jgi:hypothetical protein
MFLLIADECGASRTAANRNSRRAFKQLKYRLLWRLVDARGVADQSTDFSPALHSLPAMNR